MKRLTSDQSSSLKRSERFLSNIFLTCLRESASMCKTWICRYLWLQPEHCQLCPIYQWFFFLFPSKCQRCPAKTCRFLICSHLPLLISNMAGARLNKPLRLLMFRVSAPSATLFAPSRAFLSLLSGTPHTSLLLSLPLNFFLLGNLVAWISGLHSRNPHLSYSAIFLWYPKLSGNHLGEIPK